MSKSKKWIAGVIIVVTFPVFFLFWLALGMVWAIDQFDKN